MSTEIHDDGLQVAPEGISRYLSEAPTTNPCFRFGRLGSSLIMNADEPVRRGSVRAGPRLLDRLGTKRSLTRAMSSGSMTPDGCSGAAWRPSSSPSVCSPASKR